MATTKKQRIGIWIITAFMAVGTIGSFGMIVLSTINSQKDQARLNELAAQYQAAEDKQTKELSTKYFDTFNAFSSRVGEFDASAVTELKTEDLVAGTGDAITSNSSFSAYYIGWLPNGTTFDSSISDGALKAPLSVAPGSVITGWTKGVDGMKVGGVRELTIPSDLAYGEAGQGSIPANTPLKFVIMIIPTPDAVAMPDELVKYYQTGSL
mgnify:CR=1 FL=1